jgi:hypothetical protein
LISATDFLEQLANRRRQEQAEALQSLSVPHDLELPRELMIAVNFGGLLSPVLARSVYASAQACIGPPTSDPLILLKYFAAHPGCNWNLSTGVESGIIAVEFDHVAARESLAYLCAGDDDWHRTLRFDTAHACFALFELSTPCIRSRFNRFPGLTVHCRDGILVPPSIVAGRELAYVDPFARLEAAPRWLLSSGP